jgi:hypothetical protein
LRAEKRASSKEENSGAGVVEDEMRKRVRSAMRTRAETSRKGTKGVQPVEYCRGKGNDGEWNSIV